MQFPSEVAVYYALCLCLFCACQRPPSLAKAPPPCTSTCACVAPSYFFCFFWKQVMKCSLRHSVAFASASSRVIPPSLNVNLLSTPAGRLWIRNPVYGVVRPFFFLLYSMTCTDSCSRLVALLVSFLAASTLNSISFMASPLVALYVILIHFTSGSS